MFPNKRVSDSYVTVEAIIHNDDFRDFQGSAIRFWGWNTSTSDDITLAGAEIGYTYGHISILCATGITSVKEMTVDVIMRCFAALVWL